MQTFMYLSFERLINVILVYWGLKSMLWLCNGIWEAWLNVYIHMYILLWCFRGLVWIFVFIENVVVAWFKFKFCVLTLQPNSRAFWSIHINEFYSYVFIKSVSLWIIFLYHFESLESEFGTESYGQKSVTWSKGHTRRLSDTTVCLYSTAVQLYKSGIWPLRCWHTAVCQDSTAVRSERPEIRAHRRWRPPVCLQRTAMRGLFLRF